MIDGAGGGAPWSAEQGMQGRAAIAVLADDASSQVTLASTEVVRSLHRAVWIEDAPGADIECRDVTAEGTALTCR